MITGFTLLMLSRRDKCLRYVTEIPYLYEWNKALDLKKPKLRVKLFWSEIGWQVPLKIRCYLNTSEWVCSTNEHFLQWILNIVSFLALLLFFISFIYCTWVLLPMLRGDTWIHKAFRVLFICWWAWLQGGLVLLAGDQCNSNDVVLSGGGDHGTHIYILTLYSNPGNALASSQRKIFCSYFLINITSIEQHKWIFNFFHHFS